MNEYLHVAVGVILNESGDVLVSKRSKKSHMGGFWEFPGGKVEPGESVSDALIRELNEELGISIQPHDTFPLIKIKHQYPEKTVLLDVWTVAGFEGNPSGQEGQALKWQKLEDLDFKVFPPANKRIISLLQIPR